MLRLIGSGLALSCLVFGLGFASCKKKSDEGGSAAQPTGTASPAGGAQAAPTAGVTSCDLRAEQKKCIEYSGANAAENAKRECTVASKGDVLGGPCPSEGAVSHCAMDLGDNSETTVNYDQESDPDGDRTICESMSGKFTAP